MTMATLLISETSRTLRAPTWSTSIPSGTARTRNEIIPSAFKIPSSVAERPKTVIATIVSAKSKRFDPAASEALEASRRRLGHRGLRILGTNQSEPHGGYYKELGMQRLKVAGVRRARPEMRQAHGPVLRCSFSAVLRQDRLSRFGGFSRHDTSRGEPR